MLGVNTWTEAGAAVTVAIFIAAVIGAIARWMIVKPLESRINGSKASYTNLRVHIRADVREEIDRCRDELRSDIKSQRDEFTQAMRHHEQSLHRKGEP